MKEIDRLKDGIFSAIEVIDELLDNTSLGDTERDMKIRDVANRLYRLAHGETWEETLE